MREAWVQSLRNSMPHAAWRSHAQHGDPTGHDERPAQTIKKKKKKKSSWVCILFLTPDGSAAHWALVPL